MMKVKVRNLKNTEVSEIKLPEEVFDYPLKKHLIYEAVKNYMASRREGTASTKTRGEVSGGGRKPWRQKGTGRARAGSIRSPLWQKGGVVFGPKPRDYSYHMPKKAKRNAIKSVLSDKMREKQIVVIDQFKLKSNKTKETLKALKNFKFNKLLIIDKKENVELIQSTRNLPNVKAIDFKEINIYDSLNCDSIMFSVDAIEKVTEVLK